MEENKPKSPTRLIINIGDDLLKELKMKALERNITLRTWVLRAIHEHLKKERQYE